MSHNTFNAFFSGTDLADETASRYYGVYGFLQREDNHEFVLRVASHGQSLDLTVEDLYDLQDTDETPYMFDFEATASNVIEQPVTAVDPAIYQYWPYTSFLKCGDIRPKEYTGELYENT